MTIFGDLERLVSDLYPYRWPIAGALLFGVATFFAVALRRRWYAPVVRRPILSAAVIIPLTAVALTGGWYTLSPLWERSYLEETSPLAAAPVSTSTAATPGSPSPVPTDDAPAFPRQTHGGMFMGADDFHFGRGSVLLIETEPGVYTLRFEGFSVRNGPDLFVYLTPHASGESVEGAINLGSLKATDGNFNYEIPAGTDVSQYASAIVWCRQFATLFAVAELTEA